jgi:hypothetical protein
MRKLLFIAFFVAAFWAFDSFAFDSHYREAAWRHAYGTGNLFQFEVQRLLRKLN